MPVFIPQVLPQINPENLLYKTEGLSNALAQRTQLMQRRSEQQQEQQNRDRQFGLQELQFDWQKKNAAAARALQERQMAESARRFGMEFDLRKAADSRAAAAVDRGIDKERRESFGRLMGYVGSVADPTRRMELTGLVARRYPALYAGYAGEADEDGTPMPISPEMGRAAAASEAGLSAGAVKPITVKPGDRLVSPSGAEIYAAPPGPADRMKVTDTAQKIRKEFDSVSDTFIKTQYAFDRINAAASSSSPAAQMSLIFNYMKMLDPGSTVREGEYASAQNTTGVPGQVMNLYNAVLSGQRLNPQQVDEFQKQARELYSSALVRWRGLQEQYGGIADRAGISRDDALVDYTRGGDAWPTLTPEQARAQPPETIFRATDGRLMIVPGKR